MRQDITPFTRDHARPFPRPGCSRVSIVLISRRDSRLVVCMYFDSNASIDEHPASNDILFTVISGRGFVKIDGATQPIAAGEAILWPANILHKRGPSGRLATPSAV